MGNNVNFDADMDFYATWYGTIYDILFMHRVHVLGIVLTNPSALIS